MRRWRPLSPPHAHLVVGMTLTLLIHVGPGLGPLDLDLLVLHVDKVLSDGARTRRLVGEGEKAEAAALFLLLVNVQQSHFGSRFVFWHFNLQIGALMRRTVNPHLKPILKTSKLNIEMQIEMNWYIFFECSTVAANYNTEMQIEMIDGTVEHFPGRTL